MTLRVGSGMATLSKQELMQKMREPTEHLCGNCIFRFAKMQPYEHNCLSCCVHYNPKRDPEAVMHVVYKAFKDLWVWDEFTK